MIWFVLIFKCLQNAIVIRTHQKMANFFVGKSSVDWQELCCVRQKVAFCVCKLFCEMEMNLIVFARRACPAVTSVVTWLHLTRVHTHTMTHIINSQTLLLNSCRATNYYDRHYCGNKMFDI